MKSYNLKCLYCNLQLTTNPYSLGYTSKINKDNPVCQRCFKLLNYNEINNNNEIVSLISNQLNKIDYFQNNKIINVLDITNLDWTINNKLVDVQDKVIFVINKIDYLPQKYNFNLLNDLVIKTLNNHGFNNPNIIYTSKNNKSSVKRLYYLLSKFSKKNNKCLIIGKTNVGKSSLIKELLNYEQTLNKTKVAINNDVIISPFINTTINFKKINFKNFILIDSPGEIDISNINNYLNQFDIRKIKVAKKINSRNYFLNPNQSIMFEKIGAISYLNGNPTNFTFYFNNIIRLNRMKYENLQKNIFGKNNFLDLITYQDYNVEWIDHEFNLVEDKKHNLSINGLGLISINPGAKLIKIKLRKDVKVTLNSYAII